MSSGHVFHPGHEELHGVTVVVEGASGRTWVGRYHEQGERGIVMHDVAVHDPASNDQSLGEWVARLAKFGVRVEHRHLIIPAAESPRISRLLEFDTSR